MSKTELIELADDFKTVGDTTTEKEVIMKAKDCCVFYDDNQALKNINIEVGKRSSFFDRAFRLWKVNFYKMS